MDLGAQNRRGGAVLVMVVTLCNFRTLNHT